MLRALDATRGGLDAALPQRAPPARRGPAFALARRMSWEILLGRALARCAHPAAAWRVASARGRAALIGAYFGASYALVLGLLLAF